MSEDLRRKDWAMNYRALGLYKLAARSTREKPKYDPDISHEIYHPKYYRGGMKGNIDHPQVVAANSPEIKEHERERVRYILGEVIRAANESIELSGSIKFTEKNYDDLIDAGEWIGDYALTTYHKFQVKAYADVVFRIIEMYERIPDYQAYDREVLVALWLKAMDLEAQMPEVEEVFKPVEEPEFKFGQVSPNPELPKDKDGASSSSEVFLKPLLPKDKGVASSSSGVFKKPELPKDRGGASSSS